MANPTLTFELSGGGPDIHGQEIEAELFLDKMPITCSNIIELAQNGFYDGIHIHRIVEGFIIQFGCPNARDPASKKAGDGAPEGDSEFNLLDGSGETITRSSDGCIEDELVEEISNSKGTLAMANEDKPDTGGSQFFFNLGDNTGLDWFTEETESKHPVFGKVTRGLEVLEAISGVKKLKKDESRPAKPIKVEHVEVSEIHQRFL
eukprot:m.120594 g.120594  ORF g.120594 m.120594 type:complete len:205 (+) comp14368_c0_seq2:3378-3992(+)